MKSLVVVISLLVCVFGAVGIVAPAVLFWIAERSVTPSVYYVIAAFRVAFGLVLISVASVSRAPRAVRVLGYFIMIAGIATALIGLLAIERAQTITNWYLGHGIGFMRLPGIMLLVIGVLLAYTFTPPRRTA